MPEPADAAYVAIREEILRGRLRPGAPLGPRQLAEVMNVVIGDCRLQIADSRIDD